MAERLFKTIDSSQIVELLPSYRKKKNLVAAVTLEDLERMLMRQFQQQLDSSDKRTQNGLRFWIFFKELAIAFLSSQLFKKSRTPKP